MSLLHNKGISKINKVFIKEYYLNIIKYGQILNICHGKDFYTYEKQMNKLCHLLLISYNFIRKTCSHIMNILLFPLKAVFPKMT